MNPIEKDLKNYYGTSSDSDILEHYGTKRHSGRYPWGSGDNPYQHSGDFLSRVETLKKKGMSENEILDQINSTLPKEYQLGLTEFRVARRKAIHERKASEYEKIAALKEQGLGWKAIGEKLGMSESSVRSKYAGTADKKAQRAENIADTLKKEVDKKGMIDISEGANLVMGVSQSELDDAAYTLEAEYGYKRYGVGIRQPTNIRQQTNITVLAKPEFDQKYAYQHQDQIDSLGDYHSDDGGDTFKKLQRPASLDSSRVAIRYGDEGGLDKDGVMEIRRGVPDLDLGKSHYAQVRILVDGDHYEFQHYCRHHCTYRRSAAGSDQPDAERHGQEPSAHREHHCGAAGDGWHHDHCGTDRMVEEQLLYEGSHCGRQGVRPPEGKEREVKMIFWARQERKT